MCRFSTCKPAGVLSGVRLRSVPGRSQGMFPQGGQDLVSGNRNVSVIVPCRNEKEHIIEFLESVLAQDYPADAFEILVADGRSNDGTRQLLEGFAAAHSRVRVIDNPEQTTPYALNHAIRSADGDIIVRMDVHTRYADDYIRRCVEVLVKTGADNVGGPWRAVGSSYRQKAIALAFRSPFSSGGAGSHDIDFEGEVDSVYLGCWNRKKLLDFGLFDEELTRNQDDELNLRIIRAGGKIWQSPLIRSWYYPRSSIAALFRQYQQYGYWKVRVIQKYKIPASVRHVVPGSFVAFLILTALLTPFSSTAAWLFSGSAAAYFVANAAASVIACGKPALLRFLPIMPAIFAAYHFGYGIGFLQGVIDSVMLRRKSGRKEFARITRS